MVSQGFHWETFLDAASTDSSAERLMKCEIGCHFARAVPPRNCAALSDSFRHPSRCAGLGPRIAGRPNTKSDLVPNLIIDPHREPSALGDLDRFALTLFGHMAATP